MPFQLVEVLFVERQHLLKEALVPHFDIVVLQVGSECSLREAEVKFQTDSDLYFVLDNSDYAKLPLNFLDEFANHSGL